MRVRSVLSIVGLLVTAALLAPSAAAQAPVPRIVAETQWEVDHEMILPETGRADMGVIVNVRGIEFACPQPYKFKLELTITTGFAKWAGASMVPKVVPSDPNKYFEFAPGTPGVAPGASSAATNSGNTDAKLNIAWDVEGRPASGAMQAYQITVSKPIPAPDSATACVPSTPTLTPQRSSEMVVRMMDKPVETNLTTGPADCDTNPFQPGCVQPTTTAEGDSPGPDVLLILLGLVGFVALRRRRGHN